MWRTISPFHRALLAWHRSIKRRATPSKRVPWWSRPWPMPWKRTTRVGLIDAQVFQMRLLQQQGQEIAAQQSAGLYAEAVRPVLMSIFHVTPICMTEVLLSQGTAESLLSASHLLPRLREFVETTHNTRFLVEVLALQALLHEAHHESAAAQDTLKQAVLLAQPGGLVRVFVDLGPRMAHLLAALARNGRRTGLHKPNPASIRRVRTRCSQPEGAQPLGDRKRGFFTTGPGGTGRPPDRPRARDFGAPGAAVEQQRDRPGARHLAPDSQTTHSQPLREAPGRWPARGGRHSDPPRPAARLTLLSPYILNT